MDKIADLLWKFCVASKSLMNVKWTYWAREERMNLRKSFILYDFVYFIGFFVHVLFSLHMLFAPCYFSCSKNHPKRTGLLVFLFSLYFVFLQSFLLIPSSVWVFFPFFYSYWLHALVHVAKANTVVNSVFCSAYRSPIQRFTLFLISFIAHSLYAHTFASCSLSQISWHCLSLFCDSFFTHVKQFTWIKQYWSELRLMRACVCVWMQEKRFSLFHFFVFLLLDFSFSPFLPHKRDGTQNGQEKKINKYIVRVQSPVIKWCVHNRGLY